MKTILQVPSKCILLILVMLCVSNLHATPLNLELTNGPNITGKYEFDRFGLTGAYVITKTAEGIHIEKYDNGKTYETVTKAGAFPDYIVGDYTWENTRGAFMQTFRSMHPEYTGTKFLLYKVNDAVLAVRNDRGEVGSFKKIQGSLSDLVGSQREDVSHLIGNWNIEGINSSLRFTNGADHDLQVRYGNNVYQLDKEDGGVFETYSGESRSGGESISFKVMSPGKIKLNVAGTEVNALKSGGATPRQTSTVSSATSTGQNSSVNGFSATIGQGTTTTSSTALTAADKLMFSALKELDEDALKETFQAGANVNAKSLTGRTALHEAVLSGDTYLLDAVLDQNPNINGTDNQGRTALETAITKSTSSDISVVTSLLDRGPSISNYAIDKAISKNNDDLITAMIDAGANKGYMATKAIDMGKTDLFNDLLDNHNLPLTHAMFDKALSKNKFAIAEKMLDNNFSANYAMDASIKANAIDVVYSALEKGGNSTNAMKYGIKKKDNQLVERAVAEFGADATIGLTEAVAAKNTAMASIMLENGALPNGQIVSVSKSGNLEMLDLLLSNNADASLGLIPAAEAGKSKAVALLLEYDANPNPLLDWAIKQNKTAYVMQAIGANADATASKYIALASTNGNLEIVSALLDAGATADDGMMPATKANKLAVVQKLIQAGADASSDKLLAASAIHNSTALTNIFIQAGANPQVGLAPAVGNNAAKTMQLLFASGASVQEKDQDLLLVSVKNNCTACAKILIKEGLVAEYQEGSTGKYLMHYAAENSNAAVIQLLFDHGAEIDPVASGSTPLHLAVRNRKGLPAVDALIQLGADVNAINGKGKKVLKIAKGNKIKKLLKAAGAVKK